MYQSLCWMMIPTYMQPDSFAVNHLNQRTFLNLLFELSGTPITIFGIAHATYKIGSQDHDILNDVKFLKFQTVGFSKVFCILWPNQDRYGSAINRLFGPSNKMHIFRFSKKIKQPFWAMTYFGTDCTATVYDVFFFFFGIWGPI